MRRLIGPFAGILTLLLWAGFALGANPQESADEELLRRCQVGLGGEDLLGFVRGHTLAPAERNRILALLDQLGDPRYPIREQATRQLKSSLPAALALVKTSLQDPDLERRRRAELCVCVLEKKTSPACLEAVLRLIKSRRTYGAEVVVRGFLPYACDAGVRDEARSTVLALKGETGNDPSPTRRARRAAEQFLAALAQGDWQSFRKITGVPFSLGGNLSLDTQSDFDELFRSVLLERKHPNKDMVFSLHHVVRGEDYLAKEFERVFLAGYPRNQVRAVYTSARIDDGKEERGAIFVHLRARDATVIGIGQDGSIPREPPDRNMRR